MRISVREFDARLHYQFDSGQRAWQLPFHRGSESKIPHLLETRPYRYYKFRPAASLDSCCQHNTLPTPSDKRCQAQRLEQKLCPRFRFSSGRTRYSSRCYGEGRWRVFSGTASSEFLSGFLGSSFPQRGNRSPRDFKITEVRSLDLHLPKPTDRRSWPRECCRRMTPT